MNLDEILEEWGNDSSIDTTNLSKESSSIGKLHHKYLSLMTKAHMKQKLLESEYKKLSLDKTEYMTGRMDIEDIKERGWQQLDKKVLRNDVGQYLEADDDLIKLSLKIGYYKEMVSVLENIIKQVNNRSYHINNIILWEKFVSGG